MASYIKKITRNQVVRFLLSAGLGFLADAASFTILVRHVFLSRTYLIAGFNVRNYSLAVAISFFIGVVVNFLMSRYIVFTESRIKLSKQFFRFASVAVVGFFATQFLLNFFISILYFEPSWARIVTAFSLLSASYFIHKAFSFSLSLRHHAAANSGSGS
ncbi:GtrA family protein [Mucilaginibacter myungsuensis]|uniref:GtrA family protein n=1 Tax=Mucilaginibacter myungsuensis TaxID=649104 RepID=A0A929KZK5_9SPHI|nr:GtrA family protein [Mucilaginibacter myungsuensis]MBE9664614.1 GtrA family protein [Mucilaginibacter myungsuensis]MDN3601496.1 GtrA family protein [Mucilaginibacter myungsuensis]